jgi:hypothetical protein
VVERVGSCIAHFFKDKKGNETSTKSHTGVCIDDGRMRIHKQANKRTTRIRTHEEDDGVLHVVAGVPAHHAVPVYFIHSSVSYVFLVFFNRFVYSCRGGIVGVGVLICFIVTQSLLC